MDEQLNPQELEEVLREKDALSRAVVLETVRFFFLINIFTISLRAAAYL